MAAKKSRRLFLAAFALLMFVLAFVLPFVVGLALVARWIVLTRDAYASGHWPSVEGRILWAHFERMESDDGSVSVDYDAEYEYVVDGVQYRGRRLTLEPSRDREMRHLSRARIELSTGKAIRVYYDPSDPTEALLLPGQGPHWSTLAVGVVLLSLPASSVFALRRRRARRRTPGMTGRSAHRRARHRRGRRRL